jgi:xanthine dehydrogenase YagS FAD-binding subunit
MHSFEYTSPTSKEQVVQLLGSDWSQASVFAGGTDLLALMKDDIETPKRLVNIKSVAGLDTISFAPRAGVKIGALAHLSQIADNVDVQRNYPMLAWAADEAASPQIRNMATIGGNLCQRPRCWYYRSGMGLLALDKQGKSMLVAGDNRHAAILGNDGPALFTSPSTIAPALIAYGASIRLFGPSGPREVALEKFYVIPKSTDQREHDLKPNEIITDILLPAPTDLKTAQYEVRQKYSFDWPMSLAAVALKMNGGTVESARIVLGAVAPVPWLSQEAAHTILGKAINETTAAAAGKAAVANAKPLSRNAYKIQLTQVAVKRALLQSAKGGQA